MNSGCFERRWAACATWILALVLASSCSQPKAKPGGAAEPADGSATEGNRTPTCVAPSLSQRELLARQLADVHELLGCAKAGDAPVSAKELDDAWERFRARPRPDGPQRERELDAFGAALGEMIVRELGFEWSHCSDARGIGLALHRMRDGSHVIIRPRDFVSRHDQNGDGAFFSGAVDGLSQSLARAHAAFEAGESR